MAKRKLSEKSEDTGRRQRKPKREAATPKHWQVAEEGEPLSHLAKCTECEVGVRFHLTESGQSIVIEERFGVDVDTSFGVGPNVRPICPNGHGEMSLADEKIPVADAMAQAAAKVNGTTQPQLFDTAKPFNFEGAWMDVAGKTADVAELARIHREDAERAKQSKKELEEGESTLRRMITTYEDRRVQKARADQQRAESAESAEVLTGRIAAAGVAFDVASARALSVDDRMTVESWLADIEAHPDERARFLAELPSPLAPPLAAGEVPDDGIPAAEDVEYDGGDEPDAPGNDATV